MSERYPHLGVVTAVLTDNEPPDKSVLVVQSDGEYQVIWRDDKAAAGSGSPYPDVEHWFDEADGDPADLHHHVRYADAVHALGKPLAVFNQAKDGDES